MIQDLRKSRANKAFTLIELLVSITIAGLLVGGGIAAYVRFNDRQTVIQAGERVAVYLRQAQKNALAGQKPTSDCGTLNGYKVSVTDGGLEAIMVAVCDNGSSEVAAGSMSLSEEVKYKVTTSVTFKVNGGVDNAGSIDLGNDSGSLIYRLTVTGAGAIVEEGLQ